MFGSICKGLGCSIRTSKIQYFLHSPFASSSSILPFIRCISSNASTTQDSFTVSYLINACGLTPDSALSVSKHVQFKTPDKPDSVLALFKKHDFSNAQILDLIRRFPNVLVMNPEKTLLPKLQFFHSVGASTLDVVKIISSNPWILKCSIENQLAPRFNFFKELLQCNEKALTAIKRCKHTLGIDLKTVASNINILRNNGVPEKNIGYLVHAHVSSLTLSLEKIKKLVEEVKAMGFDPSKIVFVLAIKVLSSLSQSTWERKLDAYKRWGLHEQEILAAFLMYPLFMHLSPDKIMAVMGLFVDKLGWESSIIAKRPELTSFSLEKRLIPRASVLQFLVSKGLLEKNFRSTQFFRMREEKFAQKFINCYEESPQILKVYREKMDQSR